jgi:thioredoxin/glutathione reductase (selenoprotein)
LHHVASSFGFTAIYLLCGTVPPRLVLTLLPFFRILSGGFYRRAAGVLGSLSVLFPTRIKVVEHCFEDRSAYRAWLVDGNDNFREKVTDTRAHKHTSSPFVWMSKELTDEPDANDIQSFLGGHDDTLNWARGFCTPAEEDDGTPKADMVDDGHVKDHDYEYDLVVIGGGSGGMATAKEASRLGAKVACLDFVKPSPAGTTWGLGGTCVNVGCIPKKLMHIGALMQESMKADLEAFGIDMAGADVSSSTIKWESIRESIQNHIRGLNFKYRVALREKEVTYLNKLAKFVDPHTIEATDKKGRTSTVTASRFLICTGGRPTPLECEGGELAISSDDVFALEADPGKVLCVGASYISLECAGFLAGFGNDVTIAVRSILLRGFDRECADRIGAYMEGHNVKFKRSVVPTKLEKVDGGKIKVTFSDGSSDEYDTVLAAVGRTADTHKLGLENTGVTTNPKNGKVLCNFEQTMTPNIYAVGDVMEGCPELTPVAIQAGQLLARRLFGDNVKEAMDYVNICTTVFTPIEYSVVGLSEEECIEKYGEDNIEVYIREFMPLEWTMSHHRAGHNAYTKVIVDKTVPGEAVLGIHYVGPNAGEVMQGYGCGMKQGLKMDTLRETVGIHPTSSEEIVSLSVTKSSGIDSAAAGC